MASRWKACSPREPIADVAGGQGRCCRSAGDGRGPSGSKIVAGAADGAMVGVVVLAAGAADGAMIGAVARWAGVAVRAAAHRRSPGATTGSTGNTGCSGNTGRRTGDAS